MLKNGKEEIVYLLSKVIEKYKLETGQEIVLNTNRKNYEVIAIALSAISNLLPDKWEEFGTDNYTDNKQSKSLDYPYRKYDITGGQIKDALNGIVANPRPFLVDACYIYLFGKGRKAFEQSLGNSVLSEMEAIKNHSILNIENQSDYFKNQLDVAEKENQNRKKKNLILTTIAACLCVFTLTLIGYFIYEKNNWSTIKKDFNILPYKPSKAEIDSLEGIWLCYTGSPQARISDPDRYHKVVPNIIEIKYKNGYFTYDRFGASFNHIGYAQFQSPSIVSVYSRIKNNSLTTESPRHSLLNLNSPSKYLSAISASWSFDTGDRNKIIGIREVYIKQGKGGYVEEVINEIENASCKCKVIRRVDPYSIHKVVCISGGKE